MFYKGSFKKTNRGRGGVHLKPFMIGKGFVAGLVCSTNIIGFFFIHVCNPIIALRLTTFCPAPSHAVSEILTSKLLQLFLRPNSVREYVL